MGGDHVGGGAMKAREWIAVLIAAGSLAESYLAHSAQDQAESETVEVARVLSEACLRNHEVTE